MAVALMVSTMGSISSLSRVPSKSGPLSSFLQSRGIGNERTVFLSMASKDYIEPVINFKKQLDKFTLGGDYVVLCLDNECLDAMGNNSILGYGGYLLTESDAKEDWHIPIARMKVIHPQLRKVNLISLQPTSI
jgi:hypothetical protein